MTTTLNTNTNTIGDKLMESIKERRQMEVLLNSSFDDIKSAKHYLSLIKKSPDIDKDKTYRKVNEIANDVVEHICAAKQLGNKYTDIFDWQKYDYIKAELNKILGKLPLIPITHNTNTK